jgi:hypothetical protein
MRIAAEVMMLTPELIAGFSPYRTSNINRSGLFELKERHPLPVQSFKIKPKNQLTILFISIFSIMFRVILSWL